jgi:prefoldin subunit 5
MEKQNTACAACSKPLVGEGDFCPFCGTKIVPSSITSAIDTYIQNRVNLELSTRLKDQNSLVREIGDKAEDIVWKRITRYGVMAGALLSCILGFIAFVGIKTLDDVSKRIEPVVSAAERRAQAAKRTIDGAASKVDSVRASLDHLSHDVETQTKRVADKSGEISQKLQKLDAAITDTEKRGDAYQARSEELSRRLEVMSKTLDQQTSRVTQISKQADDFSIRQAYPQLGQQLFVTFNGARWKGLAGKAPTERWVNVNIDLMALQRNIFSPDEIEGVVAELRRSHYTPLVGMFGTGGRVGYYTPIGQNESRVLYFKKDSEGMATEVCAIALKKLAIANLKPQFLDATTKDEFTRFVIEQSGLDLQLFLAAPSGR